MRLKMVYSTCKATVLAATSALGIEFDKTVSLTMELFWFQSALSHD